MPFEIITLILIMRLFIKRQVTFYSLIIPLLTYPATKLESWEVATWSTLLTFLPNPRFSCLWILHSLHVFMHRSITYKRFKYRRTCLLTAKWQGLQTILLWPNTWLPPEVIQKSFFFLHFALLPLRKIDSPDLSSLAYMHTVHMVDFIEWNC